MAKCHFYVKYIFVLLLFGPFLAWGEDPQKEKAYTLQEILAIAEEKNPSVAAFRANLKSAEGALTSARAYPNPDMGVDLGKGKGLGEPGSVYEREYSFGLNQLFEWPGKRLYRRKIAEAEVGVAREELEVFRSELTAEVKEAFFNLLLFERIVELSTKNMETAESLVNSARLRVESGEAPELELIKARVELLKVTKDAKRAATRVVISKSALNSLLAGALGARYEIAGNLSRPERRFELSSLIERALTQHPLIRRQERVLEEAGYALTREKQARMPDINVRGSIGEEIDKRSYSIGLSIPLPLFYQRQGEIAQAQGGKARAEADLERARVELTKFIIQEYQNYQIALDQLDLFEGGLLKQADEALRLAQFSYEQGASDLLNLLDTQRVQRITLVEYYGTQFDLQAALSRLERAAGGLP